MFTLQRIPESWFYPSYYKLDSVTADAVLDHYTVVIHHIDRNVQRLRWKQGNFHASQQKWYTWHLLSCHKKRLQKLIYF